MPPLPAMKLYFIAAIASLAIGAVIGHLTKPSEQDIIDGYFANPKAHPEI